MLPFGEAVLAWRLERGLTQAALARRAGVARPNLSAIEGGRRDVTLATVRALALALEVRPGILVDGVSPGGATPVLSRLDLERVATAAARGETLADGRLDQLARWLADAAATRVAVARGGPLQRHRPRQAARAWFHLKTRQSATTAASLLERMMAKVSGP